MLRCRASVSSFRMLSSSSNLNPSFLCITTPTSTSSLSPQLPNPNISLSNSNPHLSPPPPQSMSPSKCFSATSNPITVSKACESRSAEFEAIESSSQPLVVVSFYKFADFPQHADMRKPLKDLCELLMSTSSVSGSSSGWLTYVNRICRTCNKQATIKLSQTELNKNKLFYYCNVCGFIGWCLPTNPEYGGHQIQTDEVPTVGEQVMTERLQAMTEQQIQLTEELRMQIAKMQKLIYMLSVLFVIGAFKLMNM